jgi:hypothetical protein
MTWISGALLVLLGWCAGAALLITLGLLPARVTAPKAGVRRQVRASLWWGLLVLIVLGYAISIWAPLVGPIAVAVVSLAALALGIPGWLLLVRQARVNGRSIAPFASGRFTQALGANRWPTLALWLGIGLALLTLALATLGPVTHYDAGLYQLGAIRYAAEYPAIRGIANLYGPLGYANAEPVLAALAGNGPWGSAGFRLLNGFIMALVAVELLVRRLPTQKSRARGQLGWWVLVVGIAATWIPLVAMADFWVTSPTADSAVLMVSLVAVATLADQVRRASRANLAVAIVLATVLVLLRPTMVAFAGATVLLAIWVGWRAQGRNVVRPVLIAGGAAVISGVLLVIRDVLLSGWLQYPLSLLAFDVPWRAADPVALRVATLGFARNPADIWGSITGWSWVGPWASRLPSDWAFWLALALAVSAIAVLALAKHRGGINSRQLLATAAPAAVAVALWWATTPPALRFVWGPLFALGIVPLAWGLRALNWRRVTMAGAGLALIGFSTLTLAARMDWHAPAEQQAWFGIPVQVAALPEPSTDAQSLASGLIIRRPVAGEQCWAVFPLCSPVVPAGLRPLTSAWADGLQP